MTTSGDWKLSNFELCSEKESSHILSNNKSSISSILGNLAPPECKLGNWKGPDNGFDAYQFAILIFQVFNPNTDVKEISIQNIPKVISFFHIITCNNVFFCF